jgi:SNF2 family DNA or RNA helicase
VEVTFDEQVIRTPKYNITRLQDKCEVCGKVAKSVSEKTTITPGDTAPNLKFITLECGHMLMRKIPKGTPFHTFQAFGDPKCPHEWDKNSCTLCGRKRPYDFQLTGMEFLEAGLSVNNGAACFDDMGLGKTIQAGGVVYFHPEWWPTLWIVKSALKHQTFAFIVNWLGDAHVPQIINSSKDWLIPGLKHYIVGYDMLVPKSRTLKSGKVVNSGFDIEQFNRIGIKCVILDECQQIKNVDSTRTQMVRRVVKGRKVIPLSGTPWNNRGSELFPVFNMMDPMKFNSEEGFKRNWVDYYWQGQYRKEGGIRRIPQFKEFTKDLCIRRERKEVLKELPDVNRTKLNVVMNAQEEATYDIAVEEFVAWYEEQAANLSGMAIIAAMAKMRHLVALAKITTTLDYVEEFIEDTDRKICVFAHHKDVQDILFEELKKKYGSEMPVLQFVAGGNVNETQHQFNTAQRCILVASQLAAGEGLNLQTCCDCVMHERQWNPGKEEQCEGRFIRIGSTATSVSAVYAHLEGLTTTDPQLDAIVERKRRQFHGLMNKGEAVRWSEDSIMKELAESIVRAHKAKKGKAA